MTAPRCESCNGTCVPCFGTGRDMATASDGSNVALCVLVALAVAVGSLFVAAGVP